MKSIVPFFPQVLAFSLLAGCSFAQTNQPTIMTNTTITNFLYELTPDQKTQFISAVTNLVEQKQWKLVIRTLQESKDQTIQHLIVDEWNKSLTADDDAVPAQVYTLADQWDRRLLTDQFWTTLQQTTNRKTVNAFGYVLYHHGNQDDLDHMENIEKQAHGKRGLMNAINYMRYGLYLLNGGDKKTNPGPAARPPMREE